MSALIQIVCDNCGAKYKLPETFTGSQSKCQKCGSVIAVDAQRQQSGAASAAARPAAGAKPAVARSQAPPPTNERASRMARSERASSPARDSNRGGRNRRDQPAKKSKTPWILGVHRLGFRLAHKWLKNYKPHPLGYGFIKYYKVDPQLREGMKRDL